MAENSIFADFNNIGGDNRTITLRKFAEKPEQIREGKLVIAKDSDYQCYATVTKLWDDGTVELLLDM